MGYVREKYTRGYFLKQDRFGNKVNVGAEGVGEFLTDARPRPHDKEILERVDFEGKSVIDFGFGRGEAIKYICEHKAKKVVGVDFSPSSFEIASEMLSHYGYQPELHCDDALRFLKSYKKRKGQDKFEIVIMLDFIEHIPRSELRQLLVFLKEEMAEKGFLVINTPIYRADNDVVVEGLKDKARDLSDDSPMTTGMHCNRHTKKSLIKFMESVGFKRITAKFYAPNFRQGAAISDAMRWKKARRDSFALRGNFKREPFEKQVNPRDLKKMDWKKLLSLRRVLGYILPPAAVIAKEIILPPKTAPLHRYKPSWHKIKGGILRGRWFYLDTYDNGWQTEIIEGTYDKFFFDCLKRYDLKDKTIFDVGAFIGSHTLAFAELVGPKGSVYSFEPNEFNAERMKTIFNKNKDLGQRIKIVKLVLSAKDGRACFNFSDQIDSGFSSGGFVEGSDTPQNKEVYQSASFKRCWVKSIRLDDLESRTKIKKPPDVIKIDIEGAEGEVLEAGKEYLEKHQPIVLIEIHSVQNMVRSMEVFGALGYKAEILKEEADGRVFLAAAPRNI